MKKFKVGDLIIYKNNYYESRVVHKILDKYDINHINFLDLSTGNIEYYKAIYLTNVYWKKATKKEIAEAISERLKK